MWKIALPRTLALLLCTLTFSILFAQEKRITGTITDERGAPLSGATITGKNSKAATNSDASGHFSLTLPPGVNVVIVSYVGLRTEEINMAGRTSFDLKMVPTSSAMSDVVVIGYGRARRANLTSAQTTVSSKEIER